MKRYNFQAIYDVSGSSFRLNLGAGFALLLDESNRIDVVLSCIMVALRCSISRMKKHFIHHR